MISYNQVFSNNQKWIEEHQATDANFFDKLAEGQEPEFLYIGCSDSRVTAEDMMGAQPGEIFVHRNVANVVSNNDHNASSVIEYAVGHLKVKNIVVCGHYYCGGVKAAMTAQDLGMLNPWLRNIRDVYRLHQTELEAISDEETRYRRLVELNVEEQCMNVLKMSVVQEAYHREQTKVYGWVFDIKTGKLIDLKLDIDEKLNKIKAIYDLGQS